MPGIEPLSLCRPGYSPWRGDAAQPDAPEIESPGRVFVETNLTRAERETSLPAYLGRVEWLLREFPAVGCPNETVDQYFIPFLETVSASPEMDAVAETVFRAYLPIDLELAGHQLVSLIVEHLPEPVTGLPVDRQIEFISLVMALIHKESAFNPEAVSAVGAVGLMQIMPSTAGDLEVTYNSELSDLERDLPLSDPRKNLSLGMLNLYHIYIEEGGAPGSESFFSLPMRRALIAYNGGRGFLDGESPGEVQVNHYQRRIIAVAELYQRFYESELSAALSTWSAASSGLVE
ncbi:hypothetical protein A3H38_05560 [candidate division WOR-1 bacterium RIFCSPLOWO2_02_FULL_46_20]|uniref:Transglycosylase SLT domain-containing protein n=1 Tax=candidate division WOR-1 bacterium RIFCSPLOWO2_02_FULL_46_20 TaxID=1802567 RepID=A0A1F4REU3_UNCSA|nr:MAG: hypothetical protein A3H38_05560 [candidate division WOR-1 bacterium RIFCSPLOWO2_02_FULL_46_20]